MNRGILPVFLAVVAVAVLLGYLVIPRWTCSSDGTPPRAEEETGEPAEEDAGAPPARPDGPSPTRADAGRPTRDAEASPTGVAIDAGVARPVGTGVLAGLVLDRDQSPAVGAIVTVRLDVGDEPWRPRRGGFERPEPGIATARVEMDGFFRIEGLPATAVAVEATCTGLVREVQRGIDIPVDAEAWVEFVLDAGLSISGRVTDEGNEPIAGAAVAAGTRGSDGYFAVTARDGSYELSGLKAGSYRVQAEAAGFVESDQDDVRAGSSGVDFLLGRAASISGRVVWRGVGSPVADADVRAVPSGPRGGLGGGRGGRGGRGFGRGPGTRTDRDGRFVLSDLLPGRWTVWADGPDRAPGSSQEVTLEPGTSVENLVIELGEGARIAGVVRADPDGRPIQGAVVRLGEAGASPMENRGRRMMGPRMAARLGAARPENAELTATTDASGRFELLHVAGGRQTLSASAAGHPEAEKTVSVPEDGDVEGVELRLAAGGAIAGTVSDTRGGDRLASSMVFAGSEGSGGMGRGGMGGPAGMAEVDETGRYRIDGLGEGTYRVSVFQLPTSGGGGPSVSAPQQAAVTIGETTTVDFQLGGGTAVHGRVLQAGAPVPGARVELSAVEGPFSGRVSTVADGEGSYRLDGVVPGGYVARIDRSSQRVDIPDVEDLELDLEVPSGAIAGRVLDAATGAPVAEARIVALRADEADPGAESHPWARAGTGRSGPDGTFEVTGLAAGTYDLTVSHESYASATASEEVPAGGRRDGVEVRLTGGVVVSGRVIDSQGAPVADAMVSVSDVQTGSPVRASMAGRLTGPDGAFQIRGLAPGRYRLDARARGYRLSAPQEVDAATGAQGVELVLAEAGP